MSARFDRRSSAFSRRIGSITHLFAPEPADLPIWIDAEVMQREYVVLGGGNAKKLKQVPEGARLGANANAFVGGFRLWEYD